MKRFRKQKNRFLSDWYLIVDVNECTNDPNPCRGNQKCENTVGSYVCRCAVGYRFNTATQFCEGMSRHFFLNLPLLSLCISLLIGMRFDGDSVRWHKKKNNLDINECLLDYHDCLSSQRCDNTIGSYTCFRTASCGTGYTYNSQKGRCEGKQKIRGWNGVISMRKLKINGTIVCN
jgi:fibulin 1/2